MTALVIGETLGGRLLAATARLVGCALALDAEVHLAVIDDGAGTSAAAAARLEGVARVLAFDAAQPDHVAPDRFAAALESRLDAYDLILGADSGRGRSLVPLLAGRRRVAPLTSVCALRGADRFERRLHAGAIVETIAYQTPQRFLTLRAAAFVPVGTAAAACPVEHLPLPDGGAGIEILACEPPPAGRPQLDTARLVLAGGRGLGGPDNFRRLAALADRLGAATGASRIAVDMGWVPHEQQIGQTGRRIAPALYVAFGISGAAQHVSGVRDAGCILAIDKDPDAPIFRHADFGIHADAGEILAELLQRLAETS